MKKRFLALLFALSLSVCMCVSAFAADTGIDIIDDPLSYYFQNQLLGVQKGTGVTLVCPNGDYKTLYTGGTLVTCPYDGEALVLADAGGVTAKKVPSGIGRKDIIGYQDNKGTPSIGFDGRLCLIADCNGIFGGLYNQISYYGGSQTDFHAYPPFRAKNGLWHSGVTDLILQPSDFSSSSNSIKYASEVNFYFQAPATGVYRVYRSDVSSSCYSRYYTGSNFSTIKEGFPSYLIVENRTSNISVGLNQDYTELFATKGDDVWPIVLLYGSGPYYKTVGQTLRVYYYPTDVQFNNVNNITINNNTWNGNIYVDNSNNLTYIYPQYTTINEKNETVTNISTNPIIYNNETKQYYTYDQTTKNYYYITYNAPSPSPTPAPTWTPGGGATRGGGVGRHPSDTDAADWTLHYYVLNNRRYDAYYALKKTEVDTDTKLPWVDNKKYISTTQIPIANGQYTVSVPDGVYWRVWSWDEASQTLTGVNSSNWHSTINNFLFNATGEYIFEFCKADGSDFDTAKDVTLKLKNDKITKYEDGGTIVEEPTPSPSPEPTETPSPTEPPTHTATPNPGGGTVPTPGGDSGGGNSGSSDSGWNPFKWLTDLLKDIVETILKGLWKLLTSIFGFILWLLSLLFKLFPWMPNSGILALCAGVVVVTVIRIIKFITGR